MEILAHYRPYESESIQLISSARALHASARSNALELLKKTKKASQRYKKIIYQQTRKKAYREGRQAGLEAAQAESLELHKRFEEILEDTKNDCINLACKVAKEIIQKELDTQTSWISKQVASLMDAMPHLGTLSILVTRSHAEKIKRELEQKLPMLKISVEESDEVMPGNAFVRTAAGSIELNWESHFRLLQEKLQNR